MGGILGKFWFKADRGAVCFVPNETVHVDVLQFQALVSRKSHDPSVLEQAVEMYSGPFLSGFSLEDTPEFDDWQFFRKEELEREFMFVLKELTERYASLGNDSKAIKHAATWVELDPLNESAHRYLIQLYARTGQKHLARRQYESCKQLLDSELGILPNPETSNLVYQVLRQDEISVEKIQPPQRALPVQSGTFIGRQRELEEITGRLTQGDTRLLTITGPGGIGKTRLAMKALGKLRDVYPGSLFILPLATVSSADAMLVSLSGVLVLKTDVNQKLGKQVLEFLRARKILLFMDNLEHLPEIGEPIVQMLDKAEQLKILATSRSRLGLDREQVLPLSGLPYPQDDPGGETDLIRSINNAEGTALFLSAVRRVRPDFKPTARNAHDILRICRLTSGIPLALILAGGWGDVFSPRDIADQIATGIDFLESKHIDVSPCHRSMRAVFDSSWNVLSRKERNVLMRLSVFRGQFTRKAAEAVAGPLNIESGGCALSDIIRKSLVRIDSDSGLFELHSLLVQYAGEKLEASGLREKTLDTHEHYYLNRVRIAEKELIGQQMMACRTDMDAAFANIEQAWCRAVNRSDVAAVSNSATGLYIYFDMHTHYLNGERFFRATKQLLFSPHLPFSPEAGLILLCWFDMRNQSASSVSSIADIRLFAHNWLRWAVTSNCSWNRARALLLMAAIEHKKKNYCRSIRLYGLSLAQDPEVEHAFWVTMRIGLCKRAQGMMDQALLSFEKSLRIGRDLEDTVKIAWSLRNAGSAHLCLGNQDVALPLLQSAKDLFEQIQAPTGVISSLEEMSLITLFRGEFERAAELADQATAMADYAGLDSCLQQPATALKGMALVMRGAPDQGQKCFQQIEKTEPLEILACLGMGFIAVCNQNSSSAAFYERKALNLSESVDTPQLIALLNLLQAAVFSLNNDNASALDELKKAIEHPFCPNELFDAWEFARDLVSLLSPY